MRLCPPNGSLTPLINIRTHNPRKLKKHAKNSSPHSPRPYRSRIPRNPSSHKRLPTRVRQQQGHHCPVSPLVALMHIGANEPGKEGNLPDVPEGEVPAAFLEDLGGVRYGEHEDDCGSSDEEC